MKDIFATWLSLGNTAIELQLWHVWIFALLITGLILTKCKRAIAFFSIAGALAISGRASISIIRQSASLSPELWFFYGILALFILSGVLCSFIIDD